MPPWCTCLFCIGWLGNVERFITLAELLYDSLNLLFCDVFAAVVVCARSLLLWSIKSHDVDSAVFCVPLYLCFKIVQANNYRLPHWTKTDPKTVPFAHGISGRMVSSLKCECSLNVQEKERKRP